MAGVRQRFGALVTAAKTAVGFVPIVGAFIGGAASVGETAAGKLHQSRSGIAALMKLQQQ